MRHPIDATLLFSEPEPALPPYAKTGSKPPATNPFQAPDFGGTVFASDENDDADPGAPVRPR